MLPKHFIDKLKGISIYDVASKYTNLKKSNDNIYTGKCPNPKHKDKDPSFRIWVKENSWACMVCHNGKKDKRFKNYGSDPIAFIMWIEGKNFIEAVNHLSKEYGIEKPTDKNDKLYKKREILCRSYENGLSKIPLDYLYNRGLDDEDIGKWRLGYDGKKIIFPLFDKYRQVIAFTKRWLVVPEDTNDKYKNSYNDDIFKKGKYFYGVHNLLDDFDEIRITEGPMDVILANKYGLLNTVSTLGTAFTDEHADIIKHTGKTPVFIFDGDNAGLEAIQKACIKMADRNVYCKIFIIEGGADLADLSLVEQENIENKVSSESLTYGAYLIKNSIMSYKSKVLELNMEHSRIFNKILMQVPLLEERQALNKLIEKEMGVLR